jgi:taurine dioxygenase
VIAVRETGAPLGAEILGVDLSVDLDDSTFAEIVEIFHKYEVVFFRGQDLTPEQHISFSRRFGELECHVRQEVCKPGYPEIFVVSNIIENGKPIGSRDAGQMWHSDVCYVQKPPRASALYAREVPKDDDGRSLGDTIFGSVTTAYDELPEAMKIRLAGIKATNQYDKDRPRAFGPRVLNDHQKRQVPPVDHPAVRTHPYTGRKCLFVNPGHTTMIEGLNAEESAALIEQLTEHITKYVYRHNWEVGDLLLWDNCAAQHKAVFDYQLPQRRRMERTTIAGTVPF